MGKRYREMARKVNGKIREIGEGRILLEPLTRGRNLLTEFLTG